MMDITNVFVVLLYTTIEGLKCLRDQEFYEQFF